MKRWAGWTVAVITTACILAALGLLSLSFASYERIQTIVASAVPRFADRFSPAFFAHLIVRARIIGSFLGLFAIFVLALRREAVRQLQMTVESSGEVLRELANDVRGVARGETTGHRVALALLILGGAAVRIAYLFQPMRYDEAFTYVRYASKSLLIVLAYYTPNNHVFHTLLVHFSTMLFGAEPWAIRLPALISGILMIPASYALGRMLYGRNAALLGAALVSVSSALIEFSANGRGYSLGALLFLLAACCASKTLDRDARGFWILFAASSCLALYTVPSMLYGVAALVVWLALESKNNWRSLLATLPLIGAGTLALYAPIVVGVGLGAVFGNRWVAPVPRPEWAWRMPLVLQSTWAQWNRDFPVLEWLLVAGFAASMVLSRRRRWPLPLIAGVVCLAMLFVQHVAPPKRTFLFLLPLYLLASASPVERLKRFSKFVPLAAIMLCAAFSGYAIHTQSVYLSEDTRTLRDGSAIADYLKTRLEPGDEVICPPDAVLEYYFLRRGIEATFLETGAGRKRAWIVMPLKEPPEYTVQPQATVVERFPEAVIYLQSPAP
jgi:hypothetical protein